MWALDSGDWHLGLGQSKDTCREDWVRELINVYEASDCQYLILGGDITECWKHKWSNVAEYNKAIFDRLAKVQSKKSGCIFLLRGNHDWDTALTNVAHNYFLNGLLVAATDILTLAGWRITHGNEFDPTCSGGPLTKISHGLTFIAGVIESVTYLKETWIDPTHWFSAASVSNNKDVPVQHAAEDWAEENKQRLIIHHTHYAHYDINRPYPVANPGGLTEGHEFSYLKLNIDTGEIVLVGHEVNYDERYRRA